MQEIAVMLFGVETYRMPSVAGSWMAGTFLIIQTSKSDTHSCDVCASIFTCICICMCMDAHADQSTSI